MGLEQEVKEKAKELGFDAAGITDASPIGPEHVEHLHHWLQCGYAGPMDYMRRNFDKRTDPAQLRRGAKSVIVVALNYKPSNPQSQISDLKSEIAPSGLQSEIPNPKLKAAPTESQIPNPKSEIGQVAAYAQYEDYHPFLKSLLRELASFLSVRAGRTDRYKICVDSAPLAEKALATRAGLGVIGKNHLLIHPHLGPQILLGELITTLPLQPDEPSSGACLDCDRCIKACPTGALRPDGFLDATRCISCLTQYPSQAGLAPDTHGWLFGCDECLQACPFQHQAPPRTNARFKFHPDRATLNPRDLLDLTAETFEAQFADSPLKRLGLAPLQAKARERLEGKDAGTTWPPDFC